MPLPSFIVQKSGDFSDLVEANQGAVKIPLSRDRLLQPDMHCIARKTLVVGLFEEFPVETRRSNFEHVTMWNQILDIKDQSDALTYRRAVIGGDSARLVDINPQRLCPTSDHVGVNQFDTRPSGYSFNDFFNTWIELQTNPCPISDFAVI